MAGNEWLDEGDTEEIDDIQLTEYDITSAPNDFNVKTLFDFIESGVVEIPSFQRNYVWDIKRASKLIESIIMGLPIPQIFLYEKDRNKFLVIDGQQRLLSIYYFIKQRFPRPKKRTELRRLLVEKVSTPSEYLNDNTYFTGFKLLLPNDPSTPPSPCNDLSYETLGDYKSSFDLRTIRNVIVKQSSPKGDDSIYEIFNRLNSGGVNLSPQEIRMSLYHSAFIGMVAKLNFDERWRELIGKDDADLHLKDVEILLRALALLVEGDQYKPSMAKFLNGFAHKCELYSSEKVEYLQKLFVSFLDACADLNSKAFHGNTGKFTVPIFDAVFTAVCSRAYVSKTLVSGKLDSSLLNKLKEDEEFRDASLSRTTGRGNVLKRIERAKVYLGID